MKTIVGIDIETTSLDHITGEIIEVAAIRYDLDSGQEVGRFEQLLAAKQVLETITTEITGITSDMLVNQPSLADITPQLVAFIGSDTLFAHNAKFDVTWLIHHGVDIRNNKIWDTFPLAGIAWPEAASYNLGALAAMLNITGTTEHRARADVEVTWRLLQAIRTALFVSKPTYKKILALLTIHQELVHYKEIFSLAVSQESDGAKAAPQKSNMPTASAQFAEVFGNEGLLARVAPAYYAGQQQEEMAQEIAALDKNGGLAIIEAAPGVGSTAAYLVPTLLSAEQSHKVVISTYTRHLQDQLLGQDIPAVQQALGTNQQIAVLKDRRNYVCSERLKTLLSGKHELTPVDVFALIRIIAWQASGGSGELDRLNFSHQPTTVPQLVQADAISCRNSCSTAKQCPYYRALATALAADLVVVDHTLLISMQIGSETPLKAHTIIFDEAHHLEEAARSATELDLTLSRIEQITATLDQSFSDTVMYESAHTSLVTILTDYHRLLNLLGTFIGSCSTKNRVLLTKSVRKDAAWHPITRAGARLQSQIKSTAGLLLGSSSTADPGRQVVIAAALQNLQAFAIELASFLEGNSERISWIELEQQPGDKAPAVMLHDVALTVKTALLPLQAESTTVIAISTTLKTSGNFSYTKRQLGLTTAKEFTFTSPFNYQKQLLIYLVTDMPGPISPTYIKKTSQVITVVAKLLGGRTLGLFTAKQSVKESYHLIAKLLTSDTSNKSITSYVKPRITLLAQEITGGRANMVRRFKHSPHSLLLGAGAWWTDINQLGDNLQCLVISRLPFAPPTNPIYQALEETMGFDAFTEISVPQMILRTREVVEGLIQSKTDQAVVILLDPRIKNQAYGRSLLASLPPATFVTGTNHDISPTLEKWFGQKQLSSWQKTANK